MPYRFANADPRHALIHVVWGGVILVLLARGLDHRGCVRLALVFGVFYTGLAIARRGRPPPARPAARPGRERLPPPRGPDHAGGRARGAPRRTGVRVTAAVAAGAVLASLAGVKALEGRLPRAIVRAGILVFVFGPLAGLAYADVGALARVARAGRSRAPRRALGHHRARDVARVPPPAHAPQLLDDAVAQGGLPRGRRNGGAEPAGRLGRAPPRAPRPFRSRGRPAQPGRRVPARPLRLDARGQPRQARALLPPPPRRSDRHADRPDGARLARARPRRAGARRRLARPPVGRRSSGSPSTTRRCSR